MNVFNLEFFCMFLVLFIKNKDKLKKDYNCIIFRRRSKLLNKLNKLLFFERSINIIIKKIKKV